MEELEYWVEILFDLKEQLDIRLRNKEIEIAEYNKGISVLAYELALKGFHRDCIEMLLNCSPNYFLTTALDHFDEDEAFYHKCVLIFEVLSFTDYVSYDIMATQKEGKA